MPIMIGTNEHGYFSAFGGISCVLLSTLNLLKIMGEEDNSRFCRYIDNFYRLLGEAEDMVAPAKIPSTIEAITEGDFYGRAVAPRAVDELRICGIKNPEKYGLDSLYLPLPGLYTWNHPNSRLGHIIVISGYNNKDKSFLVVDDGVPERIKNLPEKGLGFVIEKNFCKESNFFSLVTS